MSVQDTIPKSRLTLKYRTTINGEAEDVTLPFRLLLMGDLSGGTSEDRQKDLGERQLRSINGRNINDVMKDMKIALKLSVANHIGGQEEDLEVALKIEGMKSFTPEAVAQQVPQIRALLLLKTLLKEMQSNIDNRKDLRRALNELLANPEAFKAMLAKLKEFEGLRLPPPRLPETQNMTDVAVPAATPPQAKAMIGTPSVPPASSAPSSPPEAAG